MAPVLSQQPSQPYSSSAAHNCQQFSTHSGRGKGRKGSSRGVSSTRIPPKLLTAWLKSASSPEQLLQMVQQHAAKFDHIHLSAAFTQAVAVCRNNVPPQQQPAVVQQLLSELHRLPVQLQQRCEARQLANIIWSSGRLSSAGTASVLLPVLLQDSRLQQAKPQEVSSVLWAAATLQLQLAPQQIQLLLQRFEAVLQQAMPQAVANALWALATMEQQVPQKQLQRLLLRFQQLLPRCNPQDVANTLWACGKLQHTPLQLLSALEQNPQQLQAVLAAATPQAIANMAWACGQLGYRGKVLPDVLLQQAVKLLQDSRGRGSFTMQELCNICWAAAVLDMQQLVSQVLQLAAAGTQLWDIVQTEHLQQLYQVHLWMLDSWLPAPGQGLSGVLSQQQLKQCRASWEQLLTANAQKQVTDTQQSVLVAAQRLPQSEGVTADGLFSIDIAATTASGVEVAIEVDGPTHFIQPGRTSDGRTLFRNRALAARGYTVISIPYWEWDALQGVEQKHQYLLTKLQPALQPADSGQLEQHQPVGGGTVQFEGGAAVQPVRRKRRVRGGPPTPA